MYVGLKFKIPDKGNNIIYTIDKINIDSGILYINWTNEFNAEIVSIPYNIREAEKRFDRGKWIHCIKQERKEKLESILKCT